MGVGNYNLPAIATAVSGRNTMPFFVKVDKEWGRYI